MAKVPDPDRLTGQLYHLPTIIGKMGISIAEAQKQLNTDYLKNIKFLLEAARIVLGDAGAPATGDQADARSAALLTLLKSLAPSRYQFTETEIDFSADLAETFNLAIGGGVGAGFGAVVVNASLSLGFGYDYRAAARVKSVLHAIPADPAMTGTFLAQSDKMDTSRLGLPGRAEVDASQTNQVADIMTALFDRDKKTQVAPGTGAPNTNVPATGGAGGAGGGGG